MTNVAQVRTVEFYRGGGRLLEKRAPPLEE